MQLTPPVPDQLPLRVLLEDGEASPPGFNRPDIAATALRPGCAELIGLGAEARVSRVNGRAAIQQRMICGRAGQFSYSRIATILRSAGTIRDQITDVLIQYALTIADDGAGNDTVAQVKIPVAIVN